MIVFILGKVTITAGLALITQQLFAQVNIILFYDSVCVPYHNHNNYSDTACVNGTVHLVGGHNVKEGRVQVCYNREWHSICSDNWSDMDGEADVVCSTLGYSAELG